MNKSKLALAIALAFSLSACGGDDDTSITSTTPTTDTTVTKDAQNYAVKAIDGYLQGALVCLDTNKNAKCDVDSDPYDDQGNESGEYNLEVPADINSADYKVLVEVIEAIPN